MSVNIWSKWDAEFVKRQTALILSSYAHWLGKPLFDVSEAKDAARAVFEADFVLASSNADADPILNYGNQQALSLWELPWEEFIKTPGRHTAEAMEREARADFLRRVRENGYVDDYRGIRVSRSGKRFEIRQAIVWNLIDENQNYVGQAATFTHWEYI